MAMVIVYGQHSMEIRWQPGDPKRFPAGGWGDGESRFLHWLKGVLKAHGYDLIKKRMWRDGHLVDDQQQYLRHRSPKAPGPAVMLYNGHWACSSLDQDWATHGCATLMMETDIWTADLQSPTWDRIEQGMTPEQVA